MLEFTECKIIGVKHFCRTPGQCQYCKWSLLLEDLKNWKNPTRIMMDTDPECEVL